jgi:hypothetical protein
MQTFFKDLFDVYPATDGEWRYYEQKALKICVLYTNTTTKPRMMTEYRTGFDGKVELDPKTGEPKTLKSGETRWIAIEPSNKKFKYIRSDGTVEGWGAAAYPKDIESASKVWVPLKPQEIVDILTDVKKAKLVIPYYQIADTVCSLYPEYEKQGVKNVATNLRASMEVGDKTLGGLSGVVSVVRSNAKVLGHFVEDAFIAKQSIFPMGYGEVPIKKDALIIIDLDDKLSLKEANTKYVINGEEYFLPIIIRIIDAPAVKGALWTEMHVAKYKQKRVPTLVRRAQNVATKYA